MNINLNRNSRKSKPVLVVMTGYSGAGKSTLSLELGKKHDFVVLSEDNFVFKMSPYSLNARVAETEHRKFGMEALTATMKVFMKSRKSIIVEGALVDGPIFPSDLREIAEDNDYDYCHLVVIADRKSRVRRKKRKNGHVISDDLDKRLRDAAKKLGYLDGSIIIDTTKKRMAASLKELESALCLKSY